MLYGNEMKIRFQNGNVIVEKKHVEKKSLEKIL
jgi:hypothetical protein